MMIIVIYRTNATKAERVINLFLKVLIEYAFLSSLIRNSTGEIRLYTKDSPLCNKGEESSGIPFQMRYLVWIGTTELENSSRNVGSDRSLKWWLNSNLKLIRGIFCNLSPKSVDMFIFSHSFLKWMLTVLSQFLHLMSISPQPS